MSRASRRRQRFALARADGRQQAYTETRALALGEHDGRFHDAIERSRLCDERCLAALKELEGVPR